MRNRATNVFSDGRRSSTRLDAAWDVDGHPAGRLVWLLVLIALPLAAVAARLAQLQCVLVDDYVASFTTTTEGLESLPSVDGRIYGGDGRVLAEDVERYNVSVHYRWLQDPPEEHWLLQQALSKLPRAQRRNRALVDAEKNHIVAIRSAMWKRLSELTGHSPERLSEQRAAIQKRVESIAASVARRHEVGNPDSPASTAKSPDVNPGDSLFERLWNGIVMAVTTPPGREEQESIIIREELDYHPIIDDVPLEVRAEIEAHPRWFPGVRVGYTTRRVYYESSLAPHVVGSRVPISEEELTGRGSQFVARFNGDDPLDYRSGDRIGRSGVEAAYDSHLHGLRGIRKLVLNRYGEILKQEIIRAPRPGGNVELMLNPSVQRKMEQLLDATLVAKKQAEPTPINASNNDPANPEEARTPVGGCIVALDVQSGAVLVAASAPRFDFGPTAVPDPQTWKRLSDDPRHPLFHRALQMALPPGSVFKVLSAVAAVESRRIDPDRRYECRGFLERPDRLRCLLFTQHGIGHGPTNLSDALSRSCNVYFFHAAGVIGPEPIVDWARRFGIGRQTGIDLPFERGGHLPAPDVSPIADRDRSHNHAWHLSDTRSLAIGQSSLTVTPLQIARMMAAVANGGYLVTPFVARKSGPQLASDDAAPSVSRRQAISGLSEGTLTRIRAALAKTVADPSGTAYKTVRTNEITIAGKTGTAQIGGGKPDHAWFAGYAPADNPRIAFAVVLEQAGSGGKAAGPVARQLVEALLIDGVLEPTRVTMRE